MDVLRSERFLSRLCGGEPVERIPNFEFAFLSRLCGGELTGEGAAALIDFLSRLCGGERFC